MIIVESLLKGKHNLIQVTLDEVIVFFTNDSNNQNKVVLDFIEACKNHPIPAIFFGTKKKLSMDIQLPEYLNFVKQMQNKIEAVIKENSISILKNSHFALLLDNAPINRHQYQAKLDEFKKTLPNINLTKIHFLRQRNLDYNLKKSLLISWIINPITSFLKMRLNPSCLH